MSYIDILFDGPPGPEGGRFVEVEDDQGCSIAFGEWVDRSTPGLPNAHALRIPDPRKMRVNRTAARVIATRLGGLVEQVAERTQGERILAETLRALLSNITSGSLHAFDGVTKAEAVLAAYGADPVPEEADEEEPTPEDETRDAAAAQCASGLARIAKAALQGAEANGHTDGTAARVAGALTVSLLAALAEERLRGVLKGNDAKHDDQIPVYDFGDRAATRARWAEDAAVTGNAEEAEKHFLAAANIALAAYESSRRRRGGAP